MKRTDKYQRYQRQILLKEFGTAGQEKLSVARILVVGAGGLGCPALQYLAAAGVGTIGIVDFDVIDVSNLPRQILYTEEDIGKPKAETAAKKLKSLNPGIEIKTYNIKLDNQNAIEIIPGYDIVIDGSDNFSTRYLINDACVLCNKPLVYGAVLRFEGQVGVFNLTTEQTKTKTNYRDLFPEPPDPSSTLSCSEAGVLGVLPGIIGILQATETIKIITGIGKPLADSIISFNALNNQFYECSIPASVDSHRQMPKNIKEFLKFNYEWFCGASSVNNEISVQEFDALRSAGKITIIDVREQGELPEVNEFLFIHIPLSRFKESVAEISTKNKIVVFCQSGIRSRQAVKILNEVSGEYDAYSLKGGIIEWKELQENISV
ncbi:MAG: HesA/MoeB/ThiF family protein [Sphingobacteriales bacterium]|nr:HesA/MoeB/ThiF family protein [Sphingobacteriales bacterium]